MTPQAPPRTGLAVEAASAPSGVAGSLLARQLLRAVAEAPPAELPALVGALAQAQAVALARLAMPPEPHAHPSPGEPGRWITAEQAAAIAAVSKKCVYDWAQGKRWASRPTRRCLRINESGFRAWLANRLTLDV